MPAQYEAMRDKFVSQGADLKAAQKKAAMIYNSKNPSTPVGRNSDKKKNGNSQGM